MESHKITEPLFRVRDLHVCYGDAPAVRGVSLDVEKGRILGIVGESGSGKSTMIYAFLGLLGSGGALTKGSVRYDGISLDSLSGEQLRKLRGKEMALISQNPAEAFHPIRRMDSQLKELVKSHKGITYTGAREELLRLLKLMGLPEGERMLHSYAFELSGGMCQRMSIAFSMVLRPRLLFADEPTSALDVTVQTQVVEELLKIREKYGTSIFIVSHNMGVIAHMADEIAVMYAGLILESGTPGQLLSHPCHPYTQNLIRAIPRLDAPAPTGICVCRPDRLACGCPYQRGCPRCSARCGEELPPMREIASDHMVRCWNL